MDIVLDYAWGRPDPSWMKRAGVSGVMRYLCDSPGSEGKKLTADELASLLAAGLAVGCCWQETHDSLTGGQATGASEGERARTAMEALKAPAGAAVYFAADSETVTAEHATAYLKAAREALGPYRLGLYGGVDVVSGVRDVMPTEVFLWQTAAWSTDKIAEGIHLYQGTHRGNFGGAMVDVNSVLQPNWGQFTRLAA